MRTEDIYVLAHDREEAIRQASDEADNVGYVIDRIEAVGPPSASDVVFADGSSRWLVRAELLPREPEEDTNR